MDLPQWGPHRRSSHPSVEPSAAAPRVMDPDTESTADKASGAAAKSGEVLTANTSFTREPAATDESLPLPQAEPRSIRNDSLSPLFTPRLEPGEFCPPQRGVSEDEKIRELEAIRTRDDIEGQEQGGLIQPSELVGPPLALSPAFPPKPAPNERPHDGEWWMEGLVAGNRGNLGPAGAIVDSRRNKDRLPMSRDGTLNTAAARADMNIHPSGYASAPIPGTLVGAGLGQDDTRKLSLYEPMSLRTPSGAPAGPLPQGIILSESQVCALIDDSTLYPGGYEGYSRWYDGFEGKALRGRDNLDSGGILPATVKRIWRRSRAEPPIRREVDNHSYLRAYEFHLPDNGPFIPTFDPDSPRSRPERPLGVSDHIFQSRRLPTPPSFARGRNRQDLAYRLCYGEAAWILGRNTQPPMAVRAGGGMWAVYPPESLGPQANDERGRRVFNPAIFAAAGPENFPAPFYPPSYQTIQQQPLDHTIDLPVGVPHQVRAFTAINRGRAYDPVRDTTRHLQPAPSYQSSYQTTQQQSLDNISGLSMSQPLEVLASTAIDRGRVYDPVRDPTHLSQPVSAAFEGVRLARHSSYGGPELPATSREKGFDALNRTNPHSQPEPAPFGSAILAKGSYAAPPNPLLTSQASQGRGLDALNSATRHLQQSWTPSFEGLPLQDPSGGGGSRLRGGTDVVEVGDVLPEAAEENEEDQSTSGEGDKVADAVDAVVNPEGQEVLMSGAPGGLNVAENMKESFMSGGLGGLQGAENMDVPHAAKEQEVLLSGTPAGLQGAEDMDAQNPVDEQNILLSQTETPQTKTPQCNAAALHAATEIKEQQDLMSEVPMSESDEAQEESIPDAEMTDLERSVENVRMVDEYNPVELESGQVLVHRDVPVRSVEAIDDDAVSVCSSSYVGYGTHPRTTKYDPDPDVQRRLAEWSAGLGADHRPRGPADYPRNEFRNEEHWKSTPVYAHRPPSDKNPPNFYLPDRERRQRWEVAKMKQEFAYIYREGRMGCQERANCATLTYGEGGRAGQHDQDSRVWVYQRRRWLGPNKDGSPRRRKSLKMEFYEWNQKFINDPFGVWKESEKRRDAPGKWARKQERDEIRDEGAYVSTSSESDSGEDDADGKEDQRSHSGGIPSVPLYLW